MCLLVCLQDYAKTASTDQHETWWKDEMWVKGRSHYILLQDPGIFHRCVKHSEILLFVYFSEEEFLDLDETSQGCSRE